jgi:hypothetical protein
MVTQRSRVPILREREGERERESESDRDSATPDEAASE